MTPEEQIKALHLVPGDVIVVVGTIENADNWLLFSDMVNEWVGRRHLIVRVDPGTDVVKVATEASVAEEREACAKLADYWIEHHAEYAAQQACRRIANGIRAGNHREKSIRGKK